MTTRQPTCPASNEDFTLSMPPEAPAVRDSVPNAGRTGHSNVLARLQALFPSSPHAITSPLPQEISAQDDSSNLRSPALGRNIPPQQFFKVRILTWNMHDSLPKGDLEELLGVIPTQGFDPPDARPGPPSFPAEAAHPYHIVIVAGQECPSVSGIPMALGAGFKLKDKDKDKELSRSSHSLRVQDLEEAFHRRSYENDPTSPHENSHHPPSGWSSILEDWYCNSAGGAKTGRALNAFASDPTLNNGGTPRTSPYELLSKERMMGLYLAVYIHRDVKHLVKGTSKSAVTAGLIGGRVGNKGGVGVSLNINGTTFLFINAHLAGRMHHRIADLTKIKAELAVDDFLAANDPRLMAEDITDRFDFTFVFGDLNFRLDITRLHADWLISRKEYGQALAFDQLRRAMQSGEAFAGFNEAPINFPPTFNQIIWCPGTQVWTAAAARKAKEKWMALWAASDGDLKDGKPSRWRRSLTPSHKATPSVKDFAGSSVVDLSAATSSDDAANRSHKPSHSPEPKATLLGAENSHSIALSENDVNIDEDKGVYDSSNKQRVPSWCDRILWKSTVESESEDEDEHPSQPLRARIWQALRPSSLRSRKDSTWSITNETGHPASATDHDQATPRASTDERRNISTSVSSWMHHRPSPLPGHPMCNPIFRRPRTH
ncbi:inositol polyphosphate 5-phosphatase [Grifola frondosa]|uniref:Inositol polyphosphate 5-phosphatase n=1 Tax=Grifola frondosa TaxID=5627 RepID=A0A1C7M5Y3_GRIFR|nr:inositol polyphosphate 5-phosphatase [Grifola frondosa]